ncbi:MAG: zinc ABC transporter substrate-binding protein [Burkholderiaceae bacterium]|nr:zinc ABC transporter substrate-binding protein [Rhodoferax sp.]MCP5283604.1 zinc ABC transporter substrate-binding protein [Burkholderiaceae bacterium]
MQFPSFLRLIALSAGVLLPAALQPALAAEPPLPVVASFSLLGDLVQQVGGERVQVSLLVGPDSDAHAVQPTPSMARQVAGAAVLFSNGLGFEGWMDRFLRAAAFRGRHVVVSDGLQPRAAADAHGHGHGHDVDPHAWQDARLAQHYVARIAEGLCAADASHCAGYRECAAATTQRLQALHARIQAAWAAVPPVRRVVITTHEAFGYYGAAYGVKFLAAQGLSSAAEPTPRAIAELVRQIRASGTRALFLERAGDPRLMERLARETGAVIGGSLYADALSGPGGPAASYEALMDHNTRVLVQALEAR